MKITTFDPAIFTKDAEGTIKLFEELGFEKQHQKEGIDGDITVVRMKDANGFHFDVVNAGRTVKDFISIRMNVDNFDEAYNKLLEHGFKHAPEEQIIGTKTSKAVMLVSPSGYTINLIQHIK